MVNGKEKCLQEHKLELAVGGKKIKTFFFFCGIQFILSIPPPQLGCKKKQNKKNKTMQVTMNKSTESE